MDGSAELLQLAHLLRIGAEVARDIVTLRTKDAMPIERLAHEAERMADEIEMIAKGAGDGATKVTM